MTAPLTFPSLLACLCLTWASVSHCFEAAADELIAATATADITPPVGYRHGGGYNEVISTGIHDPLYAKAMTVRQGDRAFVLVECDLLSVPATISADIRTRISQRMGIPSINVVIAATHNHGSPEFWGPLRDLFHEASVRRFGTDPHEPIDYPKFLVDRILDAAQRAWNACEPMTIDLVVTRVEGLAFNRRFHMKDGTVLFNPGKSNPNVIRPAGPVDEEFPFLLFRDAQGKPKFSFSLFAIHTAVFGGTEFGADFPGHLQELLQRKFGIEFTSIFAEGCAGDINHIQVQDSRSQSNSVVESQRVGRTLFEAFESNLQNAQKLSSISIATLSRKVSVEIKEVSATQLERAKDLLLNQARNGAPFLSLVDAWRDCHAWHERSLHGPSKPMEVQVLRMNTDTAIVFLPHEVFVELGIGIRSSSPFRNTMVVSLANDVDYYIPTRRAFEEGSYEVTTCPLVPGCGERLATLAVELLNELAR
jgi:neutral ceramidase